MTTKEMIDSLKDIRLSCAAVMAFASVQEVKDDVNLDLEALDRAIELLEAEEQGKLVRLPCKIGDMVYEVVTICGCSQFDIPTTYAVKERKFSYKYLNDFGKTVFLTKEEAEKSLKEDKNEQ